MSTEPTANSSSADVIFRVMQTPLSQVLPAERPSRNRPERVADVSAGSRPAVATDAPLSASTPAPAGAATQTPAQRAKPIIILLLVLMVVAVAAGVGWMAGSRIESPAEAALRTAAPTPSPILVPVEERVLSSNVVTRGTARFGLPQPVSIAPSALKANPGLIATLPLRNAQFDEGDVLLTASGRPVFVLQGQVPAYRDLVPGISGDDVHHLEQGLERLGFDPGPIDGTYDIETSKAVAEWYKSKGWEPFGPTRDQLAIVRALEQDLADASKAKLAADGAAEAAGLAVESARATADHQNRAAAGELEARKADWLRLVRGEGKNPPLALESERTRAEYAVRAADAEIAAQVAERALVVLDPRQPETARAAADAKLKLARAAAIKTKLESELGSPGCGT